MSKGAEQYYKSKNQYDHFYMLNDFELFTVNLTRYIHVGYDDVYDTMMYKHNNVWCSRWNEWNVEKEKKKTCNGGQQWKKTMAVVGNDVKQSNGQRCQQ